MSFPSCSSSRVRQTSSAARTCACWSTPTASAGTFSSAWSCCTRCCRMSISTRWRGGTLSGSASISARRWSCASGTISSTATSSRKTFLFPTTGIISSVISVSRARSSGRPRACPKRERTAIWRRRSTPVGNMASALIHIRSDWCCTGCSIKIAARSSRSRRRRSRSAAASRRLAGAFPAKRCRVHFTAKAASARSS